MDPKDYREKLMEKVAKAAARAESEAVDPRIEDGEIDVEEVEALIKRAENPKAKVNDRLDAMEAINRVAFDKVAFQDYNAQYVRLLKQLRLDRSSKVRQAAFDRLSLSMDHDTRDMLQRSLSGEGDALVPDRLAASLLGLDDHASSRDVLRDAVKSRDKNVRKAALRGLSADTRSADLLEGIATDPREDVEMREAATISLKAASPKRFAKMAQKLAVDPRESDQIKAAAVASLAQAAEEIDEEDLETLFSELDEVSRRTRSRALKSSISRLKKRSA